LRAGIGLRAPHYEPLWEANPALGLVEVHSENFFGAGGPPARWLERFRSRYALSLHGIGLSLGSTDPLDEDHLDKLAGLVRRLEPLFVSEHLAWSSIGGRHANELLPLPFTEEAVAHVSARIAHVQERLGRQILVENVSSYLEAQAAPLAECEFVAEVVRRAGCGLLLDVNNVWVNSVNQGFDAHRYLEALDGEAIAEIHVAGHEAREGVLIDTHGRRTCDEVWSLYSEAVRRFGPRPTVVEWDTDLPEVAVLLDEARRAEAFAA
jgi:uncharacterized protein (UPF0276 family)